MKSVVHQFKEFGQCAMTLGDTAREKLQIFWRLTKNARVRFRLASYHPEAIYQLKTRYGTLVLRDNFGDVTNLPGMFCRGVYRYRTLPGNGVILDIGANIGLFSVWAAFHNPEKRIYCFEPLSSNVRLIPMNCPAAVVNRCGLGHNHAKVKLGVDSHSIMATSLSPPWPTHVEEFEVMPLDDFVRVNGIDEVALMKVDTEGMELDVLDGGRETLCRTHRVAMETHSPHTHRESIKRLHDAGLTLEAEEFSGKTGLVFASRLG